MARIYGLKALECMHLCSYFVQIYILRMNIKNIQKNKMDFKKKSYIYIKVGKYDSFSVVFSTFFQSEQQCQQHF